MRTQSNGLCGQSIWWLLRLRLLAVSSIRYSRAEWMIDSFYPVLCPMASSIITPANDDVANDFGVEAGAMVGAQAGFVHLLGVGPLFLAPMSETFGEFLNRLACSNGRRAII